MATLVYNRTYNCFELYHNDDAESYLEYRGCKHLKKVKIPKLSDYSEDTKDKFISSIEYYNNIIDEEIKFMYPIYGVEVNIISQINNINYIPIRIPINENNHDMDSLNPNSICIEKVLNFFEISYSEYFLLINITRDKKYNKIIVKNNLKLYIAPYMWSYFTLIKGKPIKKYIEVNWKDRFNYNGLPLKKIPTYYKKKIRSEYTGGSEGDLFVIALYRELWKNLFGYEPRIYDYNTFQIPEITDYDMPCCYSEEQLSYKKEKEEIEKKKKEEYFRQRELNKLKDGYCDFCGSENASYRADPCEKELNGKTVMRWLCDSCYDNCLGDI